MKTIETRTIVFTALMTAVICILAPFAIPLTGGVPISMATLAIMLAGTVLGPRWGSLSTALYIVIGAIGLPVYANYTSGFANLAGPTGGFLIGYLPLVFCVGFGYRTFGRARTGVSKTVVLILSILVGESLLYTLGTLWFMFVGQTSLVSALIWCVIPFIPGDIVKIIAVVVLTPILERTLPEYA